MVVLTDKTLAQAENWHYKFQQGCYFSGSKKIQGTLLLWSEKIKDFYWNYATEININEKFSEELIKKIIAFYKTKNRQPSIYFTPFAKPKSLSKILAKFGFKPAFKDAWMFFDKTEPKIAVPQNLKIKPVETAEEMQSFINVFDQAYGGATSEEPYGTLPKEYGECLFNSFTRKQTDKKIVHYLGFFDEKPIGIATLVFSGNYGCIYNIGTIPDYREKGIGAALTLNAVADSIKNNAKTIFLQTEQGSFNERNFAELGFSTKFIGEGFVLK